MFHASHAIMQLLPSASSGSRCDPPQANEDVRGWQSFLRHRPALGSSLRQWRVDRAKEQAAAFNARNAKAPVLSNSRKPSLPTQRSLRLGATGDQRQTLSVASLPLGLVGQCSTPTRLKCVDGYVRRPGFNYMGQLMECEISPGEPRCTYTGGHLLWQCFLPATKVHPLGATLLPLQQLCTVHYVSHRIIVSAIFSVIEYLMRVVACLPHALSSNHCVIAFAAWNGNSRSSGGSSS